MDRKVLLASHGRLAEGMADSLQYIIGKLDNVDTMCAYTNPDFNLEEEVKTLFRRKEAENFELIVFTDIYGGSVNNEFMKFLRNETFCLVSNMNFATIVEILLHQGEISAEFIRSVVDKQSSRPVFCNELWEIGIQEDSL
ncbi:PTS sugar transporter subunit IIA [Lacrimispora saccharolytica]|uniref:PTS system fructose subfamily IIA component n=1 Tax=Lacrimispora saccharolytica (strain ATCC 35040 / DSM 2544 / NRCC 2533 / WM1) TaxID=610130 RepID=D9R2R1_LACSW|nr:PTS fructose subfamily transporter subunit IIA [Lacrimispora saccharolytica]ADL06685.1 PTS system fructose subfamily IIA component [[Clostridium] saccharolyticum WM1]QRV19247.1 PTS sugar transporter [Lacrimispora saccharolytica]